jgi:hypothetical protein
MPHCPHPALQLWPTGVNGKQLLAPVAPAQWVGRAHSVLVVHAPALFLLWQTPDAPPSLADGSQ